MPKISKQPLKQNPYMTYRDPVTGRWLVAQETEAGELVPPQARTPLLQHSQSSLVPVLAESVLTRAGR